SLRPPRALPRLPSPRSSAPLLVRVAADESIRKASDPYRVAQLQAADVAIVKPAPLGGVRNTLDIARNLRDRHMDITVASALDTAVEFPLAWPPWPRCHAFLMMKTLTWFRLLQVLPQGHYF